MKVTIKGQITVPKILRKKFGIHPGVEVEMTEKNGEIVLNKTGSRNPVDRVYGILKGKTPLKSTDQFIEKIRGRL